MNPPEYKTTFETFGVMPNNIYKVKGSFYGKIPTKARLKYLFEYEVDKVAEFSVTGQGDGAKKYAKNKMRYIDFTIDHSKIPKILKQGKRPYLIMTITSLKKSQNTDNSSWLKLY